MASYEGTAPLLYEQLWDSKNEELFDDFTNDVTALDLRDVAIPLPGKNLPNSLANYSLVPITPLLAADAERVRRDTSQAITYDFKLPSGIEPGSSSRSAYLDTGLAIGLGYKDEVVGIASAAIKATLGNSRLTVVQIQGWESRPERGEYKDSGLFGGMLLWRHTLVTAWTEIARKHSLNEIAIQGAANNRSASPTGPSFPRYLNRYDQVAQDMGFTLDPKTGDFALDLGKPAL